MSAVGVKAAVNSSMARPGRTARRAPALARPAPCAPWQPADAPLQSGALIANSNDQNIVTKRIVTLRKSTCYKVNLKHELLLVIQWLELILSYNAVQMAVLIF